MSAEKKFVTAINCMDGRTQLPVINWLKRNYQADFVDTITEPGEEGILAKNKNKQVITNIKKRLLISVDKHHSRVAAIVGHFDCAGNPVSENEHKRQIKKAMALISKWQPKLKIVGLWVDKNWQVHKLK